MLLLKSLSHNNKSIHNSTFICNIIINHYLKPVVLIFNQFLAIVFAVLVFSAFEGT